MKDYIKIGIEKGLISFNDDMSRITYVHQKKWDLALLQFLYSLSYTYISINYCFVITISSLVSTSNTFAIFTSISNDGCILFEHHLETVEGSLPSCSASHLPVFFCSAKTTFNLFKSFILLQYIGVFRKFNTRREENKINSFIFYFSLCSTTRPSRSLNYQNIIQGEQRTYDTNGYWLYPIGYKMLYERCYYTRAGIMDFVLLFCIKLCTWFKSLRIWRCPCKNYFWGVSNGEEISQSCQNVVKL